MGDSMGVYGVPNLFWIFFDCLQCLSAGYLAKLLFCPQFLAMPMSVLNTHSGFVGFRISGLVIQPRCMQARPDPEVFCVARPDLDFRFVYGVN